VRWARAVRATPDRAGGRQGRELVLFTVSSVLSTLLAGYDLTVLAPGLIDLADPLPVASTRSR
jgi:hypothetical protein